ncbi:efflux RND transporter periplasmic adaptor subunit [Candidatus Uabimicrobium sp. HlEnr_7]|uniref:efflux RND transporter periplasmic adaptor subunit n=1 Tax=Candidatus Uabimicrobium helgolandensis TaxID=3095367 RepID=UPI003555DF05
MKNSLLIYGLATICLLPNFACSDSKSNRNSSSQFSNRGKIVQHHYQESLSEIVEQNFQGEIGYFIVSSDGRKHAYKARDRDKNKIFIAPAANPKYFKDMLFCEFSPDNRRFSIMEKEETEVFFIDGKKIKEYEWSGKQIVFNQNGTKFAFKISANNNRQGIVINFETQQQEYAAIMGFKFSNNGELIYIAKEAIEGKKYSDQPWQAFVNGKAIKVSKKNENIYDVILDEKGEVISYIKGNDEQRIVIYKGKELGRHRSVNKLLVSHDYKNISYIAEDEKRNHFVVCDGKKGKEYERILFPTFSLDGKKLAYKVSQGSPFSQLNQFMVVNGEEGTKYNFVGPAVFSPGNKIAYRATKKWGNNRTECIVVDGKEQKEYKVVSDPIFFDNKTLRYFAFDGKKIYKNTLVMQNIDNQPKSEIPNLVIEMQKNTEKLEQQHQRNIQEMAKIVDHLEKVHQDWLKAFKHNKQIITAQAKRGTIENVIIGKGELVSREIKIFAPVGGRVIKHISLGKMVDKGEILLQIADTDLKFFLDKSKKDIDAAEIKFKQILMDRKLLEKKINLEKKQIKANLDFFRKQNYFLEKKLKREKRQEANSSTQHEYETSENEYNKSRWNYEKVVIDKERLDYKKSELEYKFYESTLAKIRIKEEQRKLEQVKNRLSNTTIISSSSALILKCFAHKGEIIKDNAQIYTLLDISRIFVSAKFKETDFKQMNFKFGPSGQINFKQKAIVSIKAFPQKKFQSKVIQIMPIVEKDSNGNRLFSVKFEIIKDTNTELLLPGLSAQIRISTSHQKNAIIIPNTAVHKDVTGYFYVLIPQKNGFFQQRKVLLGNRNELNCSIIKGLKEGEIVILREK